MAAVVIKRSGAFSMGDLKKVIYGPGAVSVIGDELDSRALTKALVVTGRSLGNSALLDKVVGALGTRLVGVFTGATEHVQAGSVRQLTEEIERTGADVVVSFGGGSPIDAAKAAVASVLAGRDLTAETSTDFYAATEVEKNGRFVAHVAIPTTLSAGEYTSGTAVTGSDGMKRAIIGHPAGPVVIINDPELTVETPERLWASSGVKALDHAVEALYSAHGDAFTDALAVKALRLLLDNLPPSLTERGPVQLEHRGHAQTGAWLSNFGAVNTRYGLSHAIGHKIGSRWHVPHGVTSTIVLPHAMRFVAGVAPERFGELADALGVERALCISKRALACADVVADFITQLPVPTRIRDLDLGVEVTELNEILPALAEQVNLGGTLGRSVDADELESVVHACW